MFSSLFVHEYSFVCALLVVSGGPVVDNTVNNNKSRARSFRVHVEDMLRGRSSVLTIDPVEPEDFGHYNCSVANALGFHSATIVLERRGASARRVISLLVP